MKIIAYFAFTLLSIVVQFCVLDFIQGKTPEPVDLKVTSQKKRFSDILNNITQRPHALYYRTNNLLEKKNITLITKNSTTALSEIPLEVPNTGLSSTLFELLYDENTTVTEDTFTTESLFTTTELDNVSEITLFEKPNGTTVKPKVPLERTVPRVCRCNLLYKVCDINCCCDGDCTDAEQKMFVNCLDVSKKDETEQFCYLQNSFYSAMDQSNTNELFCVAKSNLPDKRKVNLNKHDSSKKYFKWHSNYRVSVVKEFKHIPYRYGDLVWILRKGTVHYLDLPLTLVNNYCSGRQPIKFLKEEQIKCNVKLTDLEIFHILSTLYEAPVISIKEKPLNSSALNCSTLHCTNWTTIVCDEATCTMFNRSLHEPLCSDNVCTNLALNVDYTFYYHESKIINATIKLYTQKVPLNVPFITQEITVKFFIANISVDEIVEYSGNPGYSLGLPIIVSLAESNHTDYFYNIRSKRDKYLLYPSNKNGICLLTNITGNFLLFGYSKRTKCRYLENPSVTYFNETDACSRIQHNINNLLGLNKKVSVSPYGNPQELIDKDWLTIDSPIAKLAEPVSGKLNTEMTKLYCGNLITGISLIITFEDNSEVGNKKENRILSAKIDVVTRNVTFNAEDISTVINIDIRFIDETKQSVYEYAGGPHLNIHLPKDFFFPFPSSQSYTNNNNMRLIMCVSVTAYVIK